MIKNTKPTKEEVLEFLRESNAIEGIYDEDSLRQAKRAWDYLIKQRVLTTGIILKTHKILMINQDLMPNQKGYFRTVPVWVGGRDGMMWKDIPKAITVWVLLMMKDMGKNRDAKDQKALHVLYETIHPFVDGNGRTGRMFMNWQRLQAGLPILIIHAGGKEHSDYYKWFR